MKKTLTIIITIIMLTTVSVSIEKAQKTETTNLPPYFSWQDIDGIDYTTPVKDQSPALLLLPDGRQVNQSYLRQG